MSDGKRKDKNVPKGQRRNVEKEQVLGLLRSVTSQDGNLHSGTVRDGLVGVDRLVGLLAVEEVRHELDNRGIRVEPPTRTISWTCDLSIFASQRTFSTGSRVERKRSWHSFSSRAMGTECR